MQSIAVEKAINSSTEVGERKQTAVHRKRESRIRPDRTRPSARRDDERSVLLRPYATGGIQIVHDGVDIRWLMSGFYFKASGWPGHYTPPNTSCVGTMKIG